MSGKPNGDGYHRLRLWLRGLDDRLLGGATRSLLKTLFDHANDDLIAWPSQRTMAKEAGIAYSTVRSLLEQLMTCDVLKEIEPQRGTRPARYQFTLCAYDELPRTLEGRRKKKADRAASSRGTPASAEQKAEMRRQLKKAPSAPTVDALGDEQSAASAPTVDALAARSAPTVDALSKASEEPASAPTVDASAPTVEPSAPTVGTKALEVPEAPSTGGASGTGESDDRGDSAGKPAAAQESEQQTEPSSPRTAPAPAVPDGSRARPVAVAVGSPAPTGGPTMAEALVGPCPRQRERPPSLGQLTPAERWHVLAVGRTDSEHPDRAVSYHCGTTLPKARQWITAVERDAEPERAAG